MNIYKLTHGTAWDAKPDRDIVKDLQDTADRMQAIMGAKMPKQAFVLTDEQLAVLKSIVPTRTLNDGEVTPKLGGIEIYSRATDEECQALATELRQQGYEVTTITPQRYQPLEMEWPILEAAVSTDAYRDIAINPFIRIGVPAHILHGNESGFNYAAERERHERFFGPPAEKQQVQAEEDS